MNLYGNRFRALCAPTDSHIVNQRIDHLTVQVLKFMYFSTSARRLSPIAIRSSSSRICFSPSLDHMLQPITLSGKIFRHSKIVLLCQQSLYLVEVQIANACCIFLLLLTIGVDLLLQAFLLFLQILAERYALGRFILIEKFLRHPVQLFQYSFLQMADRNKRTGTGFHRDMPIRTLQIVPVLRLGGPKRIAAICAPCFACENTNFSITERSAALCSPPTYLVPQFLVNNRLVRTTHNIPLDLSDRGLHCLVLYDTLPYLPCTILPM